MANYIYDLGCSGLWGADIAYDTDNIKAVLVRASDYTPSKTGDQYLDDIPVTVATSGNLTTKTITGRVIDADDVVFSSVAAGADIDYVVLYQDTGVPGTSRLIAFVDTATNLPVTPDGTDITIRWNASGIATL